jgi:hypothetical protein
LPVENIGVPSVWIDHIAYEKQRHKQCAFNLYAAAMFQHALSPVCRAFGDNQQAEAAAALGKKIESASINKFWSGREGLFVINLPWLPEEKKMRLCDRSLATAVLFDQCPGGRFEQAVRVLAECPPETGFSYPANAGWRLWALAKGGRADVIVKDLRWRWAAMDSVRLNNTLQEDWKVRPDSGQQWSHCAVAPLYITYMSLAGIRPLEPGFKRVEIRPQLADVEDLALTAWTVKGPLRFSARGKKGDRTLTVEVPAGSKGELVLDEKEKVNLPLESGNSPAGCRRYRLPPGQTTLQLKYT